MFGIRKKAADTAKRAGLMTGGLLFCAVGMAFMTTAAWLALVPVVGMQTAAFIIAAAYLGVGFVLIGIGVKSSGSEERQAQPVPEATTEGPPIVQAFMYGLQAGARAEETRH